MTNKTGNHAYVIGAQELDVGGEAFIEPEIVPPFKRDQVAKPLVSQLMGDHPGHTLLVPGT